MDRLTAIRLYLVTVISGRFEDLRAAFHLISDDPRVQAIIIAFCFGGLLDALAGFVAANTSGGVVGKMISPQNLTIAATAVGIVGREPDRPSCRGCCPRSDQVPRTRSVSHHEIGRGTP